MVLGIKSVLPGRWAVLIIGAIAIAVITALLLLSGSAGRSVVAFLGEWSERISGGHTEEDSHEHLAGDPESADHAAVPQAARNSPEAGHDEDGHAGHDDHGDAIELSEQALKNIAFEPYTVRLSAFVRSISMPGMIVERPGRSQIQVAAPMTGIVTKINVMEGAAVEPGTPLFELRLMHEELVTVQADFVRAAETLEVVRSELRRLQSAEEGVIAGRRILEQQYEERKLEAELRAGRQALLLHGLTPDQIDQILTQGKLFQVQTVFAPAHEHDREDCRTDHLFHVQSLPVKIGQLVEVGQVLCALADHCELYVEGRAFEDDLAALRRAVDNDWDVSATVTGGESGGARIDGLKVLYLADRVDEPSRTFRFYLRLPNRIERERRTETGLRFIDWRYKPGQRVELDVPAERWEERIVLPAQAVVREGAECYVYRQEGVHFERVPVHVEYQDRRSAVIAADGAVAPGDVIAAAGAFQIHLALKNRSGAGIDPHAGHNH
ncbi:efflux RND transporter periplasmic adaptor subunit [Thermopirellula anaerolimosa]